MAQYPDEEPQSSVGPRNWKSIFSALSNFFSGGSPPGNSIIVPVAAGGSGDRTKLLLSAYRAKQQAADAVAKERVEGTKRKRKVLEENHIQQYLEEKLQNAFHPENYARLFLTLHTGSNVMRRIVNETSCLYENPARRSFKDDEPKAQVVDQKLLDAANPPVDPLKTLPPGASQDLPALPVVEPAPTPGPVSPDLQTGDPDVDRLAAVLELTGAPESEETPLDKLMEAYDWDSLLDQVEKLCMVCPIVWVRPYVVYEYDGIDEGTNKPKAQADTGKLCYIIYTPENAGVVTHPNDPTQMIAWYYFAEEMYLDGDQIKTRSVIHYFEKDIYIKYDSQWKILYGPEASITGDLPVAEFRIHKPNVNSYYCDGVGDDLYESTLEACTLKTLQNQRFKDGAFKQLAIQGAEATMADQVMGGPTPIFVAEGATVQTLDLTPALEEMTKMWKAREEYLAVTYGIDLAEYKGEGHPMSGFAKKLSQGKVLKESRRRRKFFQTGEQDLYVKTCKELKANPIPDVPALDETKELVTDFAEPTFEEDPKNQAQIDALNLKFNVVSVVDILRRENPDLTDVELIKMVHRNKQINETFMDSGQKALEDLLATDAAKTGGTPSAPGGGIGKVAKSGGGNGPPL